MSLTLNAIDRLLKGRAARRLVLMNVVLAGALQAQVVKAPRYQGGVDAPVQPLALPPLPAAITPHGTVVEDIVVRVNDQVISRSDVERQEQQLNQAAAQGNVPKDQVLAEQKNMLRDMIDQQLLLSRGKTLGLNVDADVVRQLDEIRKKNNFGSMDELRLAASKEGVNFEDFQAQIHNQILTQKVVSEEVGRRLQMTQDDAQKYYNEHKDEFVQPEQIRLSEILVPTPENATDAQVAQAEAKAKDIRGQVTKDNFAELAKKYSGGPSADKGGDLGLWKRGGLAKVLEDQTFGLSAGESTQPIRTRQGFVILKVTQHDQAGPATLTQVMPQIEEAMYMQQMQPALRAYLTKLREEAYIDIQPGFVDSGASASETKPLFTAYAPPVVKKKVVKQKARFDRNGANAKAKPVIASPDTTGGRTLTGAEAQTAVETPKPGVDPATGLAVVKVPLAPPGKDGKPNMKREKIRFGQAPRNSLGSGGAEEPAAAAPAAVSPAAPGAVMASNGTASETANLQDNPLTPVAPERAKTRFASREKEVKAKKVQTVSAKQAEKLSAKPTAETADEKASDQTQAGPLGLNGDTTKKPAKAKKVKGAPKQRLEDKPAAAKPVVATPDPTVNPALAPTDVSPAPAPAAPAAPAAPRK